MIAENVRTGLEVGDCWTWKRTLQQGYGYARVGGRLTSVHRYVYEQLVGPVPDGLVIDHLCRNKACANPDHLRVTSQSVNVTSGLTHSCGHDDWYVYPGSGKRTCHTCKKDRQRRYKEARR